MKRLNKKLAGSTLIEVIIAMVLILAVFTASMALVLQLSRTGVHNNTLKAQAKSAELLQRYTENTQYNNENIQEDGYTCKIHYEKSKDFEDRWRLEVTVLRDTLILAHDFTFIQASENE